MRPQERLAWMRLQFFIRALSGIAGGAERVLCDVASELSRRGHDVAVASLDPPGSADAYPLGPDVRRDRLGGRGLGSFRALLREGRPDVAIGFMHTGFLPLVLASAGLKLRTVASEHTVYAHYRTRFGLPLLLRASAPFFDAFTIPSAIARDSYPDSIRRRMTVIPNSVSLDQATSRPEGERRRLLAVGNLRSEKGHAILIEAFRRVAAKRPEWDLRIAGDGVERPALAALVERHGLASRVQLVGRVSDIAAEYASASLFVSPSAYESFGIATAEALAAGLPVVAFADCTGTNGLVRNGVNGLLVEGEDRAGALAGGLGRLMDSDELREVMGAAGPASVEFYSVAHVADLWEQLLDRVRAGRPA